MQPQFPNETIDPGGCTECGVQCDGFFGGSEGSFRYAVAGTREWVVFNVVFNVVFDVLSLYALFVSVLFRSLHPDLIFTT